MSEKKDSFRHDYIFFMLWNCCVKVVDVESLTQDFTL